MEFIAVFSRLHALAVLEVFGLMSVDAKKVHLIHEGVEIFLVPAIWWDIKDFIVKKDDEESDSIKLGFKSRERVGREYYCSFPPENCT